jgi:hypothetical protein
MRKGSAEAKAWGEKMRKARMGNKSKTHKGDEDYTTKKGDKDHHVKGKNVKGTRPFTAPRKSKLSGGGRGQNLVH